MTGWITDIQLLKGAIGVPITTKANTAVCLLLSGVALLLARDAGPRLRIARGGVALLVALVGGLTAVEHLTGRDFGIDQILFSEPHGAVATSSPGRMGPPASFSFVILGLGLAFLDLGFGPLRRVFRYAPLVVTLVSLMSITGFVYGSPAMYGVVRRTEIAWPTAVTLLVLSIGVISLRSDNVLVQIVAAPDAGGMAARRLLVPSVIVPFVLLYSYGLARNASWFDETLGQGILAVLMIAALSGIVLLTARRLSLAAGRKAEAEQHLLRSERELNDFFENATIGLHWVGADGIILRANKAEMTLLGYSREEYIGHHISEFHSDQETIADILTRLQSGEEIRDCPAQLRCKDGSIKDVLIDSSVLWENGVFVHTRCFTRDVTDRMRSEIDSRRLQAIVESSNDAIVSKDLNGIITSWNPGAERLFGYKSDEIIGQSIMTLIPPDRTDEEQRILNQIRRGEQIEIYETVRRRKDGTLIEVSASISPILDQAGRVIGASKIARNITERRQAEREREILLESERAARAEAERAIRMRDEFLAVVSHELRSPLNGILGWAHLLGTNSPQEETREGLAAIERSAKSLAQLIEDLLDMNRILSGKLYLNVRRVDLSAVIASAISTIRPTADARGLLLHADVDANAGTVMGDPNRLQQIVWNLLSNAVKFTPQGGNVDVRLRQVDSDFEITVSDTGVGIKPEFLPHVFERFRQADSSTTRRYGGLGLGLSIVKQLVELHGGSVQAHSAGEGRGATFSVRLPTARAREMDEHNPGAAGTFDYGGLDLSGTRVLVVDDEVDARQLIKRVLAQCHADVVTAGSAEEGMEVLKAQKPDVLVSDIGMPDTDGYQFIRQIRRLSPNEGGKTPAIALTAFARSEDRTRAMVAGYQTHIAKPIEPQELVATVASFMGRRWNGSD